MTYADVIICVAEAHSEGNWLYAHELGGRNLINFDQFIIRQGIY